MKTFMQRKEDVKRDWYIIDAKDQVLGKVATKAASILRGKHKVTYTPHIDDGDYIIIINAQEVLLTGNKMDDKKYYHHSQYAGGLKTKTARELLTNKPIEVISKAIKGMLPHNRLGRQMYKKLFVYADGVHPHMAQKPKKIEMEKE